MALWGFNHLVFDTKMMTLFSMLFGAGLVLMSDRAEARGAKMPRGLSIAGSPGSWSSA